MDARTPGSMPNSHDVKNMLNEYNEDDLMQLEYDEHECVDILYQSQEEKFRAKHVGIAESRYNHVHGRAGYGRNDDFE